ncbi:hypothetical protein HPB50_006788 [Hyalomma asiaticum]|uniref:Uncharacterized protein n=1 Tax=Hyalomma asiaticum TaxID=266040 RepID=A0ACB7SVU5_HYAAI|nr:hypothetical protein HPB50_006788 [Hyalomma asiaticum]
MSDDSRSTGYHCAVFGCDNSYRKRKKLAAETCEEHHQPRHVCGCKMFKLHRFPVDDDERRLWIACVNRKDFVPSAWARVCSEHFVSGERSVTSYAPMLKLGYPPNVRVSK